MYFFFCKNFIEIYFICLTIHSLKVYNSVVFGIFPELCSHHHSQFQNIYITPKETSYPSVISPFSPHLFSLSQPPVCFLFQQICPFWTFCINDHIQSVAFCDSLLLLSIMFLRLINIVCHDVACISTSFFFMSE